MQLIARGEMVERLEKEDSIQKRMMLEIFMRNFKSIEMSEHATVLRGALYINRISNTEWDFSSCNFFREIDFLACSDSSIHLFRCPTLLLPAGL